jgi:hypothetical protein
MFEREHACVSGQLGEQFWLFEVHIIKTFYSYWNVVNTIELIKKISCTAYYYHFEKYPEYSETYFSKTLTFPLVLMEKLCLIYAVSLSAISLWNTDVF